VPGVTGGLNCGSASCKKQNCDKIPSPDFQSRSQLLPEHCPGLPSEACPPWRGGRQPARGAIPGGGDAVAVWRGSGPLPRPGDSGESGRKSTGVGTVRLPLTTLCSHITTPAIASKVKKGKKTTLRERHFIVHAVLETGVAITLCVFKMQPLLSSCLAFKPDTSAFILTPVSSKAPADENNQFPGSQPGFVQKS